jgi:hypothetical protein
MNSRRRTKFPPQRVAVKRKMNRKLLFAPAKVVADKNPEVGLWNLRHAPYFFLAVITSIHGLRV